MLHVHMFYILSILLMTMITNIMQGKHSRNSSISMTFRMRIWLRLVCKIYFYVHSIAEPYAFMYMYIVRHPVTHRTPDTRVTTWKFPLVDSLWTTLVTACKDRYQNTSEVHIFLWKLIGNEKKAVQTATLQAGTQPRAHHPPCPPQRLTCSHGSFHHDSGTWTWSPGK